MRCNEVSAHWREMIKIIRIFVSNYEAASINSLCKNNCCIANWLVKTYFPKEDCCFLTSIKDNNVRHSHFPLCVFLRQNNVPRDIFIASLMLER